MTEPAPTHAVPLTAREALGKLVPGFIEVLSVAAGQVRSGSGWNDTRTLPRRSILDSEVTQEFLGAYGRALLARGFDPEEAYLDTNLLGTHAWTLVNFELHRRKLFWVDESLAWMLGETQLDVEGQMLRLPFPSFAFVYTDPGTLNLAEACLARDPDGMLRGQTLKVLTVHVTRIEDETPPGTLGLEVSFYFDARSGKWPYLIARSLYVRPDDRLDVILDSHFPDIAPTDLDDVFRAPELKALVHLVLNSILFVTSSHEPWRVLASPVPRAVTRARRPGKGRRERAAKLHREVSSESVFHMPGKIPIAYVRKLCEAKRRDEDQMYSRFMVRGHWRRAAVEWKDQRVRWIEPYWKGPDMAAIIEREYVLKKQ